MRKTGKVTKWFEQRGFGFIRPDTTGPDIFVHASAIPKAENGDRSLEPGQSVSFIVKETVKGLVAAEVRPLNINEGNWSDYIGIKRFPKKDFD